MSRRRNRNLSEMPAHLLAALEESSGLGISSCLDDYIWIGEDNENPLTINEILDLSEGDLGVVPSLKRLVSAIVRGHPDDEANRSLEDRVEIAVSALCGRRQAKGPEENDSDELLDAIALEYLKRKFVPETLPKNRRKPSWRSCISHMHPDWSHGDHRRCVDKNGNNPNDNIYRRVMGALRRRDLDKRMMRLSLGDDDTQNQRAFLESRIVDDLQALGIQVAAPPERRQEKV